MLIGLWGGVWRTFSNQYKENLKRIWDEETLGKYKTVSRVKKDHWFESSFCLVMALLQFKTTIIVYTDFSERKIRSVMMRRRTRIGGEGEKEFDPQARMDTQAYIFHNDRVIIKLEEKINFHFKMQYVFITTKITSNMSSCWITFKHLKCDSPGSKRQDKMS